MLKEDLVSAAQVAKNNAYAPYSHFKVGAAVLTQDGKVFMGCNVENAAYGLTMCAERNAIFTAIGAGNQQIKALAVVGDTATEISPCGACRQVMSEFCNPKTPVYLTNKSGDVMTTTVEKLLPGAFTKEELNSGKS